MLLDLPWWSYLIITLVLTHITIVSVTIFLHRHQAHRALNLHPLISHFFRFWLWLTTGMVTKEWTAVHRKHHAYCERSGDPHSPQIFGINKVLWDGAALYRLETRNKMTLEKFGQGTPDDWLERNLYTSHSKLGITLMLIINVLVFGPIGLTIWAVQMMWVPFFAAGVVNGLGHYRGYRNFLSNDTSTNIIPWGIIIGGEELHNNHHAYPSSAKLSAKWFEFDIGWFYIRTLEILGLAQVKKTFPKWQIDINKTTPDSASLKSIINQRYFVLMQYVKIMWDKGRIELDNMRKTNMTLRMRSRKELWSLLWKDQKALKESERKDLQDILKLSTFLHTAVDSYHSLQQLWTDSSVSQEELVHRLQSWCSRAKGSGIAPLESFSKYIAKFA